MTITERQQLIWALAASKDAAPASVAARPPAAAAAAPPAPHEAPTSAEGAGESKKRHKKGVDWRGRVKAVVDSDLAMCVLRYLAAVVLVCAPSDVVAYRQNCPSFRGDPVVSHYACAFKYPHHMAAYAEELPGFWYKYPRNDQMRRHRPWKPRALLGLVFRAAARATTNTWCSRAMQQMSTGLPQALSRQRLWQKAPGEAPGAAVVGDKGEWYFTDANDDTPHPTSGLSAVQTIDVVRSSMKGKQDEVTVIRTMDDWKRHGTHVRKAHESLVDFTPWKYNSNHAQRKQALGLAADMYAVDMGKWKHGNAKAHVPDQCGNMDAFDSSVYCSYIEDEIGLPYLWLSCYLCLLNGATTGDLRSALATPVADFLRYVAHFNDVTGINPGLLDVLKQTPPEEACSDFSKTARVVPPAIGDGQGRSASTVLAELSS